MDENFRFIQVLDELKEKGIITDYVQAANDLGTNKAGISDIKSGRKKLSIELLRRLKLSYPTTNIEWIIMGEGITPSHQTKKSLESLPVLKPIEAESQDEKFLSNIIRLIEDHLSDADLNVNALCELSGFSNKQIYRKIKQLTGMSPVEYIKSIRMKKAAMLLQQKKFTIAEVMYMVGFSNHSYFSKCFQSEFGKTPRQYLNEEL